MQSARREQQIERHLHVVEGGIAGFVPADDRILSAAECEALATEVVKAGVWNGVELTPTESHTRAYALLYEDERMEMWVLSWLPNHSTGFHDHGESTSASASRRGRSSSSSFASPNHRARRRWPSAIRGRPGATTSIASSGRPETPALSVHVYSPPLRVVGQYRYDESGTLRRARQAGRDELTKD